MKRIGPYEARLDNLLSMFLGGDFECPQQLANFMLDSPIMIIEQTVIL
jgi:hypothetical protein